MSNGLQIRLSEGIYRAFGLYISKKQHIFVKISKKN